MAAAHRLLAVVQLGAQQRAQAGGAGVLTLAGLRQSGHLLLLVGRVLGFERQLDGDPFANYTSINDRGALVVGKVKTVDARGAEIQLNDDVTGYLRASELSRDRVEDARNLLKEGDEVSVMIINVDRKARSIQLSLKAKDAADQQEQMTRLSQTSERENAGTTSLGALLRAKLDNRE